jgi:hypothetical protein
MEGKVAQSSLQSALWRRKINYKLDKWFISLGDCFWEDIQLKTKYLENHNIWHCPLVNSIF